MKITLYIFCLACFVFCALNIWCVVNNEPSYLHLNLIAAMISGLAAVVCAFAASSL